MKKLIDRNKTLKERSSQVHEFDHLLKKNQQIKRKIQFMLNQQNSKLFQKPTPFSQASTRILTMSSRSTNRDLSHLKMIETPSNHDFKPLRLLQLHNKQTNVSEL